MTRLARVEIAGRQRGAAGAGDGEEDAAIGAAGNPDRVGLGDAGEGRGEVLVVGDRDGAAEGEDRQRRVGADVVDRLRVLAAGGGQSDW